MVLTLIFDTTSEDGLEFYRVDFDFEYSDRRTYIFYPEKQHWDKGDYWRSKTTAESFYNQFAIECYEK